MELSSRKCGKLGNDGNNNSEIIFLLLSFFFQDGFLAEGSGEMKLVLVVRNDLKMGKGKAAAQVC